MKNIQKIIISFLFLLVVFHLSSSVAFSQDNYINSSEVPNSSKIISLRTNKKPISHVLRKIAYKGKFNIIIAPGFIDNIISLNLRNVSIKEALDSLNSLSEFGLICKQGNIIVKTIEKPEINIQTVPLKHSQSIQIAYSLNKSIKLPDDYAIGYDEFSNSIILKGDNDFLEKINNTINKLDLPKNASTFTLNNYTASQAADYMNKKIFKSPITKDFNNKTTNEVKLEPVFNDETEYIIKGIIEKSDFNALAADQPIIIPENENNKITIIGNSYQLEIAKAFLSYVDGKKIDKDEEIRRAHREIYETKKALKLALMEIEESQKLLSQGINNQNIYPNTIIDMKEEVNKLSLNINNYKSDRLWNSLITSNSSSIDEYNITINQLSRNINDLEFRLAEKEKLISNFESNKKQLFEQLKEKDNELKAAYKELNELKSELDNSIRYSNNINVINDSHKKNSRLEIAQKNLKLAKSELIKVQQQLKASKQQLELIFGGKILNDSVVPNSKSNWF